MSQKNLLLHVGWMALSIFSTLSIAEPTKCEDMYAEWSNFSRERASKKGFAKWVEQITGKPSHKARKESVERNLKQVEDIESFHPTAIGKSGKIGLTTEQINELYNTVLFHPVASLAVLEKYNAGRGVGFCFGRAMTVHLEALFVNGLHNSQIKKLWVVGDMGQWGFHVTAAVYSTEGKWIAVDPIKGGPMPVRDWYESMKATDRRGDLLFFETEAKRFGPTATEYRRWGLQDPYYNEYFTDLLNHYKKNFQTE